MMDYYWHARGALMLLQSIAGAMLFSYSLKRKPDYFLRFIVSTIAFTAAGYAFGVFLYSNLEGIMVGLGRSAISFLVYFCLIAICWLCLDEGIFTALFVASSGYIAQDLAGSLKTIFKLIPAIDMLANGIPGVFIVDAIVYTGCFTALFILFRPYTVNADANFDDKTKAVFSFVVLMITLIMARLTQGNPDRNNISILAESLYQVTCGILILLLQFGVMERAKLSRSFDAMRELVHHQHEQFRQSKESVDLVNEKYHDLKGLLEGFQGQVSTEQLDKLKAKVGQYDTYIKTGNRVLDIVLAEKRAICNQRGIELTDFINGADLDFIEELDLYSLIGNTLNNAIDAVSKLPEGERFIMLKASCEDGMVTIHEQNPFSGELVMEHNLPKSQRDSRYHGFGMQSMERIVEKYDGSLSVKAEGGMFNLDILLFK